MNKDYSKRTLQRLVTKEMKRFKMEEKHLIDNRSSQSNDNSVTADTEDVCENNSLSHDETPEGFEEYIERPEVQEDVFIGRERIHLVQFQDYHTSSDETSDNDDDGSETSEMPSQGRKTSETIHFFFIKQFSLQYIYFLKLNGHEINIDFNF